MSESTLTVRAAAYGRQYVAQLAGQLDEARARHAAIVEASRALVLPAVNGDIKAAKKLDALDAEKAELTVRMERLRAALTQAESRAADEERQEALAAAERQVRNREERFERCLELARACDLADPAKPAYQTTRDALVNKLQTLRFEADAPAAQALRVQLDRVHESRLRGTSLEVRSGWRAPLGLSYEQYTKGLRPMLLRPRSAAAAPAPAPGSPPAPAAPSPQSLPAA